MEHIICPHCQGIQPKDWHAGDLCVHCGNAIRQERRCHWCVKWTPQGQYCRECGTELVEDSLYGVARMLKSAGVDKFTLPQKIKELAPEQKENFQRIYQKHYALLLEKVAELQVCQKYLVQQDHTLRLEEELTTLMPFSEEQIKQLTTQKLETLEQIYKGSSIASNKILAGLACLRSGNFTQGKEQGLYNDALQALGNQVTPQIAWEATFTFIHWRMYLEPFNSYERPDVKNLATIIKPAFEIKRLEQWSAVVAWYNRSVEKNLDNTLNEEKLKEILKQALQSKDQDLQCCTAICLEDETTLNQLLQASNKDLQSIAAVFLARQKSTKILDLLITADDILLQRIIYTLRNPLPEAFYVPLIEVIQHPNKTIAVTAFRLLEKNFTPDIIDKIIQKTVKNKNISILNILFKSKFIADLNNILKAAMELPLDEELGKVYLALSENWQMPDYFMEHYTNQNDPKIIKILVAIAGAQLMKKPEPSYKKFIINTIFNTTDTGILKEAIWALIRPKSFFVDGYEQVHFDEKILEDFALEDFILKLTRLLNNHELLLEVGVYEWVSDFLESYDIETEKMQNIHTSVLNDFFTTLITLIKTDYWLYLRTSAAKLLAKTAEVNKEASRFTQELEEYLKNNEVLFDLSQNIEGAIEALRK